MNAGQVAGILDEVATEAATELREYAAQLRRGDTSRLPELRMLFARDTHSRT